MDLIECKNIEINRHPWELSRVESLIKEIKHYHVGKNILDIGCGDSYFDYRLMNEIKDIDKFYGIDIFVQDEINDGKYFVVNDYKKLKNKTFDTILMFDVLEHIEDDAEFLKKTVTPLLKKNGKIIMTVPAYQKLFSKHDEELKHYRRYNIKMIKDACRKSGFKVIKYHYFYALLVPLRIITKLLNKDNKVNSWKKKENHFMTKFMKGLLNLDYKICKKMNKLSLGLSLFIVLEKS
jgi:2-polyprenyl-3-methyl-5-hydroxy-6-metoxy-1,4-benzoquinol methylase